MTTTLDLHCDVCARMRAFAQPVCVDDHGGECPDWACTGCGTALVIAPVVLLVDRSSMVELRRPRVRRHAPTHDRRAA